MYLKFENKFHTNKTFPIEKVSNVKEEKNIGRISMWHSNN